MKEEENSDQQSTTSTQVYDAGAKNRFVFEKEQNGKTYEIGHTFKPLTDERYMQWNRDLKVRGDADEISEESREATAKLWDDLIDTLDNVEMPEGVEDFRPLVGGKDKVDAINNLLAVAIVEPEEKAADKFKLDAAVATTQTIVTEAWFNGKPVQQQHVMVETSFELEKKYQRIQTKRLKQEPTRGLRRKAKIEYIPQDEKIGELYDEMCKTNSGFADGNVPLRFKTMVIHYMFAAEIKVKSLGK